MEVLADLGDLFMYQKDYKQAAAIYGEIKQKSPKIPAGYVKLSTLYMVQGNWDKAGGGIKAGNADEPPVLACFHNAGTGLRKAEKIQCRGFYTGIKDKGRIQWMHLPITSWDRYLLRRKITARREEAYIKAMDVYEAVLAKQPEMLLAANDLAFLLAEYGRKSGDLDKALALANKAMAQAQENPAVLDTLGWVYYKRGDNVRALDLLGKAKEKVQRNANR